MKEESNPSESHVRQLTVSYLSRPRGGKCLYSRHLIVSVPFIRLCGKWLEDAGFFPSDRISIKVENRKLVIEIAEMD